MDKAKFADELKELLVRYEYKRSLILLGDDKESRVIAHIDKDDAGDCELSELLESCLANSKQLRKIVEHFNTHQLLDLVEESAEELNIKIRKIAKA